APRIVVAGLDHEVAQVVVEGVRADPFGTQVTAGQHVVERVGDGRQLRRIHQPVHVDDPVGADVVQHRAVGAHGVAVQARLFGHLRDPPRRTPGYEHHRHARGHRAVDDVDRARAQVGGRRQQRAVDVGCDEARFLHVSSVPELRRSPGVFRVTPGRTAEDDTPAGRGRGRGRQRRRAPIACGAVRVGIVILPEDRWWAAEPKWRAAEEYGFDHAWTYDHLGWRNLVD